MITTSIQDNILFGTATGIFGGALLKSCYDDVKEKNGRQKCCAFPIKRFLVGTALSMTAAVLFFETFFGKRPASADKCIKYYTTLLGNRIKTITPDELHNKLSAFHSYELLCNPNDSHAQIANKFENAHDLVDSLPNPTLNFEQWFKQNHCPYKYKSAAHEVDNTFFALTSKKMCK